ncbi:hypothetical protein ACQKII_21300 [Lysinibacillus sp. NPDC048646]|uniref:hypothetical protein n=1 Tax=Lysinibacillus sp. NPDC048646 TaxID=3390574 RepID=UPI003CFEA7BC
MATFQTAVPSECVWDEGHHVTLRFVAKIDKRVVGWIAISPVSACEVYSGWRSKCLYLERWQRERGLPLNFLEN